MTVQDELVESMARVFSALNNTIRLCNKHSARPDAVALRNICEAMLCLVEIVAGSDDKNAN